MKPDLEQRVRLVPVNDSDFDRLVSLRIEAMRESLERVGRFNPDRARERLRSSFHPEHTRLILLDGEEVGFYTFRHTEAGFQLDHLYILPGTQSQGLGSFISGKLIAEADLHRSAIHLGALKESRSNQFYRRNGFEQTSEDEWDVHYTRSCRLPNP